VGLLYKNLGRPQAVQRALDAAVPKLSQLKELLLQHDRSGSPILLYCWRGGGRSAYTQNQILKMGFEALSLNGGHKSYRREVYESLYLRQGPKFLVLKGLTGVGKTDLLRAIGGQFRVMDLELYARHCASSFGSIPYERAENFKMTQKGFEDQLFHSLNLSEVPIATPGILCESESRRIGKIIIPPKVFESMLASPTLEITASLESRVERIFQEYIGETLEGLPLLKRDLERIKKYVSKEDYQTYLDLLNREEVPELLGRLLENYYDTRYSGIYNAPILSLNASNLATAKKGLLSFISHYSA